MGYPTVAAALSALRAKPGVRIQDQQGWIIVTDTQSGTPNFMVLHAAGKSRSSFRC